MLKMFIIRDDLIIILSMMERGSCKKDDDIKIDDLVAIERIIFLKE